MRQCTSPRTLLSHLAAQAGLVLPRETEAAFTAYLQELQRWNRRVNLTALRAEREILVKHFLDSLMALKAIPGWSGRRVVDLGTGAGFPGLPLRLAVPEIRLVLVEASFKKAAFLSAVVRMLGVPDVRIAQERIEQFAEHAANRQGFDAVLIRALGKRERLLPLAAPLVASGGRVLLWRGKDQGERTYWESEAGRRGFSVERRFPYRLPDGEEVRQIVVLKREAAWRG